MNPAPGWFDQRMPVRTRQWRAHVRGTRPAGRRHQRAMLALTTEMPKRLGSGDDVAPRCVEPGRYSQRVTLITRLIYARRTPGLRRVIRETLALYGVEFPPQAEVGPGLIVEHRGFGLVVSGQAAIGSHVTLFHGVTLGRADVAPYNDDFVGIKVGDNAVIGAGAKILGGSGSLSIHNGCVIGANSVLLRSTTGENEVWAGAPARRVGLRTPPVALHAP